MSCTFIPPYLVSRLAGEAAAGRSTGSDGTLRLDDRLRSLRAEPGRTLTAPAVSGDATWVVHDAGHGEELPGLAVRRGADPATGDPAVDEAFDAVGHVWDLFETVFNRSSVDGNSSPLAITVHFGKDYDNAFWDGRQLVFGDGDSVVFSRFTSAMDVLAHEFAHGVTQFTAGLAYQGQPGALNESVSDVFAALTKQRSLGQPVARADWLIGEGIFAPGIRGRALRSMDRPGTAYDDPRLGRDPQVATMAAFVDTEEDNGGVHLNSGIPNRAFATAATRLGGHSWERAGRVWYDAITSGEVVAGTDFAGFARATLSSAARLFPDDPAVGAAVLAGWSEVGVNTAAPAAATAPVRAPAQTVAVRRSGGFAGLVRSGQLDLDADPEGPEVRQLLTGLDLAALTASHSQPDRFVYTVEYGTEQVTLPEQDLTPELHRVVQIVLGDRGGPLGP